VKTIKNLHLFQDLKEAALFEKDIDFKEVKENTQFVEFEEKYITETITKLNLWEKIGTSRVVCVKSLTSTGKTEFFK